MYSTLKMQWKHLLVHSLVFLFSCILRLSSADVVVLNPSNETHVVFPDFPAQFSPRISSDGIQGYLVISDPENACSEIAPPPISNNTRYFLLVKRYGCTFEEKAMRAYEKGYGAVIIYNIESNVIQPFGRRDSNVYIPTVLVGKSDGNSLYRKYTYLSGYSILLTDDLPFNLNNYLLPFAIVVAVCFVIMLVFTIVKCIRDRRHTRRNRLPSRQLKKIPTKKYKKGDQYDVCAICLDDYMEGDKLRILPCSHAYHNKCIDPWLTNNKRNCPVCKRKVFVDKNGENSDDSDSDDDGSSSRASERTPLLTSTQSAPPGRSNYGFNNRSLLMQAEDEEDTPRAGPSSLPDENLITTRSPPEIPDVHDHPVVVTIVPSIHSVNADESDSLENCPQPTEEPRGATAAAMPNSSDSSGSNEGAHQQIPNHESRRKGRKKKPKKSRNDLVV